MGSNKVAVEYDPEANIVYIKLREAEVAETRDLAEDVYADLDRDGNIVGVEIWRARELLIGPLSEAIAQRLAKA